MAHIRILPEVLANKIAAGEVVERPASVVKELVENALDAGSSRILVEVQGGGRRLIQVADDGCGMARDDAMLCLERFATSKIAADPDLFAIQTLGFRGEALPSIAAVSRFRIITRTQAAAVGTDIQVEGGRMLKVTDAGAAPGTLVTVRQLFYNTPARRKFLRSVGTEMGHIADTMAGIAMGWARVHLRLVHNERLVKNWSRAADDRQRVADVLGAQVRPDALAAVQHSSPRLELHGWLASPDLQRSTSRGIYIFVNGRHVRDRVVQHAIFEGYRGRLMKGRFPVAALFLKLPFDQVDVNVHPTKHEIRFARQAEIHDAVRDSVAQSLKKSDRPHWPARPPASHPRARTGRVGKAFAHDGPPETTAPAEAPPFRGARPAPEATAPPHAVAEGSPNYIAGQPYASAPASEPSPSQAPLQHSLWQAGRFSGLQVVGQLLGTYIVCEAEDGMVLIDQHAAHERITFEKLQQAARGHSSRSQRLLVPETLELSFNEARVLTRLIPDLGRLGLEIEPFGGNTFLIQAVPTLLEGRSLASLVHQMVEKVAEMGFDAGLKPVLDACLILMACHRSIRAHQTLSPDQVQGLLEQLDRCENPSRCPHGRPVWFQLTRRELERRFRRIQ